MFTPSAICPTTPPPTHTHPHTHTETHTHSPVASVWLVWLFGSASVSIIRQLYREQKKKSRGKRHIITCFLSTAEPDPDRTCEKKKKSIRRCCLGYVLPLVFPASKNNAEEPEVGGSPPIGVSQPLERGVKKASSGREGEKNEWQGVGKKIRIMRGGKKS